MVKIIDFVDFCRFHLEMSLSKSSKENYHLDRKSKAMVIQAIKEIEIKEDGKKRSKREIAAILGPKLGRKISHTTVGKLMKKQNRYL